MKFCSAGRPRDGVLPLRPQGDRGHAEGGGQVLQHGPPERRADVHLPREARALPARLRAADAAAVLLRVDPDGDHRPRQPAALPDRHDRGAGAADPRVVRARAAVRRAGDLLEGRLHVPQVVVADVPAEARPVRRGAARADGARVHDGAREDAEDRVRRLPPLRRRRVPRRARRRRPAVGHLPPRRPRARAQGARDRGRAGGDARPPREGLAPAEGRADGARPVGRRRDAHPALRAGERAIRSAARNSAARNSLGAQFGGARNSLGARSPPTALPFAARSTTSG